MKRILSLLLILSIVLSCSKETVTPTPTPKYSLVIAASEGGSVNSTGGTYDKGTKVTVTATPDGEYLFDSWSDGSKENPREITVTSNLDLTANFIKKQYDLIVNIVGDGTVEEEIIVQGSSSSTTYNSGSIIRLTAIPNENRKFDGWSGDVNTMEITIDITVSQAKTVTANFDILDFNTQYFDKPTIFLPNINTYISEKLNLRQFKQPLSLGHRGSVFDYNSIKGANDGAWNSDFLVGDWNNDGFNDFFMSSMTSGEVEGVPFQLWMYDNTQKTMVDRSNLIDNNIGQSFARKSLTCDFNGDGVLDFVSVSHPELEEKEFSYLDVVLSNGTNWEQITLSKVSRYSEVLEENGYYHGVDVGDVDNDGDIDIVVAMWHNVEKGMSLWRNDGFGNFTEENNIVSVLSDDYSTREKESMSFTSDLIDINNDGCLDLAINWFPTIFKYGNCDGTFGPEFLDGFYAGAHGGILSYDIDSDGDDDLIFRYETPEEGGVQIYLNNNNSYSLYAEYPAWMGEPYDIKDVNSDGFLDIIGRDPYADGFIAEGGNFVYTRGSVLLGKGNLNFETKLVPPISQIQDIMYNNENNSLEWSFINIPIGDEVVPSHEPHLENLRGDVDEWYIHFSESPFYFTNESDVQTIIIDNKDLSKEKIVNNTFRASVENIGQMKEGYYRIGYKDLLGIVYPLSYEVNLSYN